ncbi:uncharacterized protein LOC134542132 isoform X1 [Bacillus rossius redtenbacheri]|uniref:uncharacterized protein LOC134542132 isoform X1 n=1 Tax=Bacillus rossius redtenbacheri TaxID=93214 RepID=UPI002FDCA67F
MLSRREALQLGTLLLCVPAQYLLLVSVPSVLECTHAVLQATSALRAVRSSLLGWMFPLTGAGGEDGAEAQESPAIEVLQLRERAGHWASSPEPRLLRPSHLLYRVGQAVRHRALGFRAVVVGWDLRAKAPETWLRNQHRGDQEPMKGASSVVRRRYCRGSSVERCRLCVQGERGSPHYLLLVDRRDRSPPAPVYVPQGQLENYSGIKIQHPDIGKYFDYYDGAQYLPKEKLKYLYPKD